MDVSNQDSQYEQEANQMLEAFRNVIPMIDKGLQLEPDPRHPKRRKDQRRQEQSGNEQAPQDMKKMQDMLKLMATMLLRQDQDLQSLKRNDSFMFYFSKEPSGTLSQMLQAADDWRNQSPATSPVQKVPLRTHLMLRLLNDLLTRVTTVSQCKKGDQLYTATIKNKLMLEDFSWPFLHWSQKDQQYVFSTKKAIGMKPMLDMCSELIEHFRNPLLTMKFHALQDKPESKVIPWRLQVNARLDAPFEILTHMSFCSVWGLLGTQLKPHLQVQSPLATVLQDMLGKEGQREREDGHQADGEQTEDETLSDQTGDLMTWDHLDLAYGMMHLQLANTSNVCYANAGVSTVLWTMLCVQPFMPAEWGPHFNDLTVFLMTSGGSTTLETESWFAEILMSWGTQMPLQRGSQQDSCEFLCHLIRWLETNMYHMGWERRYVEKEQCHVDDRTQPNMLIRLCFEPHMVFLQSCTIDDLIRPWHQDKGMCTCLLQAPQCVLLQIDRMHQTDDGELHKCHCQLNLIQTCSIPIFRDDKLRFGFVDYVPVAAIAHLGIDQAGHYRCALRTQPAAYEPGMSAAQWLLTDDNCKPTLSWHIPDWFGQNTVTIALVRTDCLALHLYRSAHQHVEPAESAVPAQDPMQAILKLCQNMPGNTQED